MTYFESGADKVENETGIFDTTDFLDILKKRYSGEVSSTKYQSWIEAIELTSQRLKAEVEKVISEFINMRIESENRVVSKYDTIFSINDFEELKKRLFG